MVGHGVLVDLCRGAFLRAQATGEVAEMVDRQRQIGIQGFADRFAVVPGFGQRQHLQPRLDAIGDRQQHVGALLHAGFAPGVRRRMRRVERQFDVFGVGTREFGDRLAGHRRGVGEVVAGYRFDEFAANVVAIAFAKRDQRARQTGVDIFHVKHLSADDNRRYCAAPVSAACRRSREKHAPCQIDEWRRCSLKELIY
jgi:hypothetical protein